MKKYKLFIDCDDVIVMSSPLIQKDVENNTRFKSSELISRERLLKMLRYFQKKINDNNISLEELAMLEESLKYEMNANDVIRVELFEILFGSCSGDSYRNFVGYSLYQGRGRSQSSHRRPDNTSDSD